MATYEAMLEEGFAALPPSAVTKERFEVPLVKGHIQGNTTVITNFEQILDVLQRSAQHFLKFLTKELASPMRVDSPRLVILRKVSASMINSKIQKYCQQYVLCKACGKPDTSLVDKKSIEYISCSACGAESPAGV